MSMQDRRDFLKAAGVALPASVVAAGATLPSRRPTQPRLTPEEVFTLYVSETLKALPFGYTRAPDSVVRALIEAQGAGLAMVLMHLQQPDQEA